MCDVCGQSAVGMWLRFQPFNFKLGRMRRRNTFPHPLESHTEQSRDKYFTNRGSTVIYVIYDLSVVYSIALSRKISLLKTYAFAFNYQSGLKKTFTIVVM